MAAGPIIEAPVAVTAVIALAAFVGYLACRGLLVAWENTLGAVFVDIANALTYDKYFVHIHFGGPFIAANNAVLHKLSSWAESCDAAAGRFWHDVALLQEWATGELAHLARDVGDMGWSIIHGHIPKAVQRALEIAFPPALLAKLIAGQVAKLLPKATHVAKAEAHAAVVPLYHYVLQPIRTKVIRLDHAATAELGSIARWRPHVNIRLRRLEKLLGAAAFAAAMANVLGVTTKCVRSGNVGKAARAICGLDSSLFAALLAGLAVAEYPLSIEELAHEFLSVFDDVFGLVTKGVSELEGL